VHGRVIGIELDCLSVLNLGTLSVFPMLEQLRQGRVRLGEVRVQLQCLANGLLCPGKGGSSRRVAVKELDVERVGQSNVGQCEPGSEPIAF